MTDALMVDVEGLDPDSAPGKIFDEFVSQGRLGYQRCPKCAHAVFPPRVVCSGCGSGVLQWWASEGRGTVYSLSRIEPRGAEAYTVALIDLDEGFRMMSQVSCASREPRIGDEVRLEFASFGENEQPVFVVDNAEIEKVR